MNFRIFEFTHHKFQVRHLKKRVEIYISCFYPLIFGCTIYFNITCFDSFGEGIKYALPNKSSISTSHIYIYIYIYIYNIYHRKRFWKSCRCRKLPRGRGYSNPRPLNSVDIYLYFWTCVKINICEYRLICYCLSQNKWFVIIMYFNINPTICL